MYTTTMFPYSGSYLYWCLTYICEDISALCMYVTVTSLYTWDWGVTGWYQSLGSHIFSTTSRQINVILIYNWSAWVLTKHSNYKYDVIFSFLIFIPWIPSISSLFSSSFSWFFLWILRLFYLFTFQFLLFITFHFLVSPSCYLFDQLKH